VARGRADLLPGKTVRRIRVDGRAGRERFAPSPRKFNVKCPTCDSTDLVMSDRAGIEIDYCPKCRGVWLDRGELDKIIERSASQDDDDDDDRSRRSATRTSPQQPPMPPPPVYAQPPVYAPPPVVLRPDDSHHGHPYQKRRKSWLSEIFD